MAANVQTTRLRAAHPGDEGGPVSLRTAPILPPPPGRLVPTPQATANRPEADTLPPPPLDAFSTSSSAPPVSGIYGEGYPTLAPPSDASFERSPDSLPTLIPSMVHTLRSPPPPAGGTLDALFGELKSEEPAQCTDEPSPVTERDPPISSGLRPPRPWPQRPRSELLPAPQCRRRGLG
jgi:hypothetical protein